MAEYLPNPTLVVQSTFVPPVELRFGLQPPTLKRVKSVWSSSHFSVTRTIKFRLIEEYQMGKAGDRETMIYEES
jgi:hypothetical protein